MIIVKVYSAVHLYHFFVWFAISQHFPSICEAYPLKYNLRKERELCHNHNFLRNCTALKSKSVFLLPMKRNNYT